MLRYLEETGLVVPARRPSGYRVYDLREVNQLRSLRELRACFGVELSDLAFAARLRQEPGLRDAVHSWLSGRGMRTRVGTAQARAAAGRLNRKEPWRRPSDTT
jgi:DNA-binding transcriptional MerR regulator